MLFKFLISVKKFPKTFDRKQNLIQNFLNAFSLQSNYDNLMKFSSDEYEIAIIYGIQFLCSVFMILANICIAMDFITNNQLIKKSNNLDFITMSRKYANYLIDTFFFLR